MMPRKKRVGDRERHVRQACVLLPVDVHRKLRMLAAQQDSTIDALLREIIVQLVDRNERGREVEG